LATLALANLNAQTSTPPLKIGIIGDSTVATFAETAPHRGWGQALPEFFAPDVSFLNLAKAGASSKTFPAERWQKIIEFKPDFVLIEFGFNDQHGKDKPESTDAATDFKENLRRYVGEAQKEGITPILVTPNHRRTFDSGNQLTVELEPYATAMMEVGKELNVSVVDLYERSNALYASLGEGRSDGFTLNKTDNADRPGKGDRTHFTSEGAHAMARLVAEGLADLDPRLKAALKK
jgi:lysophospholipase L1-like esterase